MQHVKFCTAADFERGQLMTFNDQFKKRGIFAHVESRKLTAVFKFAAPVIQ